MLNGLVHKINGQFIKFNALVHRINGQSHMFNGEANIIKCTFMKLNVVFQRLKG